MELPKTLKEMGNSSQAPLGEGDERDHSPTDESPDGVEPSETPKGMGISPQALQETPKELGMSLQALSEWRNLPRGASS